MPLEGLAEPVGDALRACVTHPNPQWGRKLDEPEVYRTWRHEGDDLTLPRGAMRRVREVLKGAGLAWSVEDLRTWRHPEPGFPDHLRAERPYQTRMREAGETRENCLLHGSCGCLAGMTTVTVNRAGKGSQMRLDHVVRMFAGGVASGKRWNLSIPTFIRAPFPDGSVRLARLLGATASGAREVWRLKTDRGDEINATLDHRFLTPGGWVPLGDLEAGSEVLVDASHGGRPVPTGKDYVRAVRAKRPGIVFLDPKEWVVHHADEDSANNDPDNLEVVTHARHREIHADLALKNILGRLVVAKVVEIERVGVLPTYDLEIEKAEAFVANGIAVHNSGKTTVLYSLLARLKRRSLVMVWTGGLLKQWRDRAVEEFGMSADDVGIIQGSTERIEPLTLCMQQTIASRFKRGDFSLCGEFDVFLYDEVQRAPAVSSFASIDPFSARYRIGVSADSDRKDEKQFLTRDLFGDVAEEITEAETIEAGATVDVEVYVMPTRFWAPPHYLRNPRLYPKLIEKMAEDEDRNALVLKIARTVVDQGEQVLIFTHRVEHARTLDSRLVGLGIRSGALLGGKDNELAFERAVAGFKSGDHRAGVGTYQAVAQAIDLPSVSRGICTTPISNNKQTLGQVRGRICRGSDGKSFGRIYYLLDPMFGRKPVRNFVEWFKTVKVWDGTGWVDGAEWLRRSRAA